MPRDNVGGARASDSDRERVRALDARLWKSGRIDAYRLTTWLHDREGSAPDWVWGLPYIPLLSTSFREVIDTHRSPTDEIQWLPAVLHSADGIVDDRWIPHFPGERDILDIEWTDWGPSGLPIRWFLAPEKMIGVAVIELPNSSGNLIVNGDIMRALRRAKLTGYRTMRARVADETP